MKSKRIKGLIGLSLTTLLVLAACGGDGELAPKKQRADQRKLPLNKNLK